MIAATTIAAQSFVPRCKLSISTSRLASLVFSSDFPLLRGDHELPCAPKPPGRGEKSTPHEDHPSPLAHPPPQGLPVLNSREWYVIVGLALHQNLPRLVSQPFHPLIGTFPYFRVCSYHLSRGRWAKPDRCLVPLKSRRISSAHGAFGRHERHDSGDEARNKHHRRDAGRGIVVACWANDKTATWRQGSLLLGRR